MIAKITRGERVGDIAAYLHGPGKANEHFYTEGRRRVSGGMVVASNIGAEGATEAGQWAGDLRQAQSRRPDITKPIWQASLRVAPKDREMGDREWAAIASRFMDDMGVGEHPWVAVRHGKDHIHVVVSRVNDDGVVWHGRNDRRQAQSACARIEKQHDLISAPRRKQRPKQSLRPQREAWREATTVSLEQLQGRRRVGQLSQSAWDSLDPAVRDYIAQGKREKVPGAKVRPAVSSDSGQSGVERSRPQDLSTRYRATQVETDRGQGYGLD